VRRSVLLSALASAAFAAAGATARGQVAAPYTVRIATPGNDGNALAFYAQALGLFAKYGIDPQIQVIRAGGGSTIIAGIVGNAIDVGESDVIAAATAYEHGVPVTLLAPSYMFRLGDLTSVVLTAADSTVHVAKDLEGKTIGVPSLSGVGRLLTTKWLIVNGVDLSTVKFVEMPQISMAAALARGTIAAAQSGEPNITAAGNDVRILFSTYAVLGKHVQATAWCTTADWARNNPEAARRFAAAIHDAAVWADDPGNHARSAAILQQWLPFPAGLAERMHRAYYGQAFELAALQPLLDAAFELKALQTRVNARDLINQNAGVRG
jgi:ABC-type nitrate/sulfonate/bicarbonate transport system substrate-binding protein